jgi:chromosomal replication initiator protein
MYLCREMADFSYPRIGEFFGGRDHTTVIHAYEKIVKKIKEDPNCEKTITYLVDKLKQ